MASAHGQVDLTTLDVNAVRALIAAGADINARSAAPKYVDLYENACAGMTPLHLAGYPDPAIVDFAGSTLASGSQPAEAARILLAAGADINARDADGRMPLEHAAELYSEPDESEWFIHPEKVELVRLLEGAAVAAQQADAEGPPPASADAASADAE